MTDHGGSEKSPRATFNVFPFSHGVKVRDKTNPRFKGRIAWIYRGRGVSNHYTLDKYGQAVFAEGDLQKTTLLTDIQDFFTALVDPMNDNEQ